MEFRFLDCSVMKFRPKLIHDSCMIHAAMVMDGFPCYIQESYMIPQEIFYQKDTKTGQQIFFYNIFSLKNDVKFSNL